MHVKKSEICIFILLLVIVFQAALENTFSFFSYFDEILALLIFLYAMIMKLRNRGATVSRKDKWLLFSVLGYAVLGTAGSLIHQYQAISVTIKAFFLAIKWFLAYYGTVILFQYGRIKPVNQLRNWPIKTITYILFLVQMLEKVNFPGIVGIRAWDVCAKSVFLLGLLLCTWDKKSSSFFLHSTELRITVINGSRKGICSYCAEPDDSDLDYSKRAQNIVRQDCTDRGFGGSRGME